MSKFVHLSLFTALLGLGTQLAACGEDGATDAAASSPKDVCDAIAKNAKEAGEEIGEDDLKQCEEMMTEAKKEIGDDHWATFAGCAMKAKEKSDLGKCENEVEKAMKESASKS